MIRRDGISVIVSCQNEESLVAASVLSFLRLADEIIVVDNGSNDRTKDQVREVAEGFPEKVRFFDRPDLTDLWQNRQAAFEKTKYRWLVRADSDYVCYTSGERDAIHLRHWLLSMPAFPPKVVKLRQETVSGDLRHRSTRKFTWALSAMSRVYSWVPGMRFARLGRWEGVKYPRLLEGLVRNVDWDRPVWLHVDVKDNRSYFLRSERTNWRQRGDFQRWPTVEEYLRDTKGIGREEALDEYAALYFDREIAPTLTAIPHGEITYPDLVQVLLAQGSGYQIERDGGVLVRRYCGTPDVPALVAFAGTVDAELRQPLFV